MARNRLQQPGQYGDHSAPASNQGNPYAAAAAPSNNPYAQPGGQYGAQPSYPPQPQQSYAQPTSYGQQDQYAAGGAGAAQSGDFWGQLSATNALIEELQRKIGQVNEAHQATMNSTDQRSVQTADAISEEARALREQCAASLKQLFKAAKGNKAANKQATAAKEKFRNLLQEHQRIEADYRKKSEARVERQFRIVKPDATPEEVRDVVTSDNPQVFTQALLNTNRMGEARGVQREVQQRHVEIQKIERTMGELAQMFNEMAMLVEQQDEAITNVEAQTQQVDHDIQGGNVQLDKAIIKAKKARRKKWICFWILIIILIIIALAVGLSVGLKKATETK